jgi:hypothetical protein
VGGFALFAPAAFSQLPYTGASIAERLFHQEKSHPPRGRKVHVNCETALNLGPLSEIAATA